MSKVVQLSGGTRETQDLYTGPEREVTVDESNWNLRLHDGSTPGGREILSRDNNDGLYQAKSPELDGLLDFTPQQRGFLARLGPADYRLRQHTVATGQLTITNANGYAGNPLFGLAATITSDHTLSGDIIFSGNVSSANPITTNIVGNVVGNITGDVTGNVVGNLTGDASGDHTGSFTGDVDVSSHTITFANGQIPLAALAAAITEFLIPPGVIVMWSGVEGDIPADWFLCDGDNGTPDLRDRFILGAGNLVAAHDIGGATDHDHGAATGSSAVGGITVVVDGHTLTTAEVPAHRHFSFTPGVFSDILSASNYPAQETAAGGDTEYHMRGHTVDASIGLSSSSGGGGSHSHTGTATADGPHSHTVTSDNHTPPFYALCFIMKGA